MSASKNDKADVKPALEFVHPELWLGAGRAMRAGETKYGAFNFLKGHGKLQLCASIMRHVSAIMMGQDIDPDTTKYLGSTVTHLDCIAANISMMLFQQEYKTQRNDRPTSVVDGEVLFEDTAPSPMPITSRTPDRELQVGDLVRFIGEDHEFLYIDTKEDYTISSIRNVPGGSTLTLSEISEPHSYNIDEFELISKGPILASLTPVSIGGCV